MRDLQVWEMVTIYVSLKDSLSCNVQSFDNVNHLPNEPKDNSPITIIMYN